VNAEQSRGRDVRGGAAALRAQLHRDGEDASGLLRGVQLIALLLLKMFTGVRSRHPR
jgi:hypothetical protein